MTSVWLEVKRALLADAERARNHVAAEAPVEARDGLAARGHVHDRLHDEMRAFDRIGAQSARPREPFYPDEGVASRTGSDGERPWRRRGDIKDASEVNRE